VDEVEHLFRHGQQVHHDDPHLRRRVLDLTHEAVTVVISQGGVQEYQHRFHLPRLLERCGRSIHCGDDLEVGLLGQHGGDAVAHQPIVLHHQDRDSFTHNCPVSTTLARRSLIRGGVKAKEKPTLSSNEYAAR